MLALENLWLITVAVTLLVDRRSPEPQPRHEGDPQGLVLTVRG
jgi:hypothetical protein